MGTQSTWGVCFFCVCWRLLDLHRDQQLVHLRRVLQRQVLQRLLHREQCLPRPREKQQFSFLFSGGSWPRLSDIKLEQRSRCLSKPPGISTALINQESSIR